MRGISLRDHMRKDGICTGSKVTDIARTPLRWQWAWRIAELIADGGNKFSSGVHGVEDTVSGLQGGVIKVAGTLGQDGLFGKPWAKPVASIRRPLTDMMMMSVTGVIIAILLFVIGLEKVRIPFVWQFNFKVILGFKFTVVLLFPITFKLKC